MIYLYVTKTGVLCSSKKKGFTNCLNRRYIGLPDENPNNPITMELLCRFYQQLKADDLLHIILNNRPSRTTIQSEMKSFLKNFGLNESFINSEYPSIESKYDGYFTRINRAYQLLDLVLDLPSADCEESSSDEEFLTEEDYLNDQYHEDGIDYK